MAEIVHSNHPPDEEQLPRVDITRGESLRENMTCKYHCHLYQTNTITYTHRNFDHKKSVPLSRVE